MLANEDADMLHVQHTSMCGQLRRARLGPGMKLLRLLLRWDIGSTSPGQGGLCSATDLQI